MPKLRSEIRVLSSLYSKILNKLKIIIIIIVGLPLLQPSLEVTQRLNVLVKRAKKNLRAKKNFKKLKWKAVLTWTHR